MAEAATVATCLRVVPQFRPDEYDSLRGLVAGKLDRRLSRWTADQVELELSVKSRDTPQQRVTLEAWVATEGRTRFVGTSTERSLPTAVAEARDDVHRQIDRFITKRETSRKG